MLTGGVPGGRGLWRENAQFSGIAPPAADAIPEKVAISAVDDEARVAVDLWTAEPVRGWIHILPGMNITINPPSRRSDLLAAGLTDDELRTGLRHGRLLRIGRGLYAEAAGYAALSGDERYRVRIAGLAARNPELVISHQSAAAMLGLPLLNPDTDLVHLTRPGRNGHRYNDVLVVHTGRLDANQVVEAGGRRCTGAARAVLDIARTTSLADAVVVADAALQRKLVTPHELTEQLLDAINHKGRPRAARALARVDGRSESPGESVMRLGLDGFGLPPLELQIEIRDESDQLVGRTDGGFIEHGVLLEFDGLVKYGALLKPGESPSEVVVREKRREQAITDLGWLVLRVVWAELRDPRALARRVANAIARRRTLVAAGALRGSAVPLPALLVPVR